MPGWYRSPANAPQATGACIRLTRSRTLTPDEVEVRRIAAGRDPQLDRAVTYLKGSK